MPTEDVYYTALNTMGIWEHEGNVQLVFSSFL